MTQLYVSNTSTDELKDQITTFAKNELNLEEFEFFVRSYSLDGTNDHVFECAFHESCYDLFYIDQFIQSLNNTLAIGYSLFLPDGSPVFKAWENGAQVSNICEPEEKFETSDTFKQLFPNVSNFEKFHEEVDKIDDNGIDEMLVTLMKELTKTDSSKKLSSPKESFFSVSDSKIQEVKEFEVSDFGECVGVNGIDFNYWS